MPRLPQSYCHAICGPGGLLLALLLILVSAGSAFAEPFTPGESVPDMLEVTVNLDLATVGGGEIQVVPDKPNIAYGESVRLTAQPAPSWDFLRWESEVSPLLPWWNNLWDYRILARVGANGVGRTNQPAILTLNFTQLLTEIGQDGTFEPSSIRVVEIGIEGQVLNANVPFQFEAFSGFDPLNNAAGLLIIGLPGATTADQTRLFHVYFGLAGSTYPAPSFAPWVTLTAEGIIDEGLDAYKIETLNGTYYYQKAAAGFSSLVDADGADWIQYSTAPGGSGEFRGIPNAVRPLDGGHLHPGRTSAQSRVIASGPLRTIVQSDVVDPTSQELLWSIEWRFYPNHVEATMLANTANFWFLYEGTPGGTIGPEDMLTLADGTTPALADSWSGDLSGPDWAFFSDATAARSLFLYDRSDEEVSHSYRPFVGSGSGNILMTVFGFGRPLSQLDPAFSVSPAFFSLGLTDETSLSAVGGVIRAVSTGFAIQYDAAEYRLPRAEVLPADNPLELMMTANRAVTAYFAEGVYTLTLNTTGDGMGEIVADPAQSSYLSGTPVLLQAEAAPGSVFSGWSGDLSGMDNPADLSMTNDTVITASFVHERYQLTTLAQGGQIVVQPPAAGYFYGDRVTLTPIADANHTFIEWQGDALGNQVPLVITMTADIEIEALFKPLHRLTTSVPSGQQGLVLIEPDKPRYVDGENLRLSALAAANWRFIGWLGDLSGSDNPVVITMDGDKSIQAQFGRRVSLNVMTEGPGVVSSTPARDPDNYAAGETVIIEPRPADGWSFAGWAGDVTGDENPLTLTLGGDTTVIARFRSVQNAIFLPLIER